MVIQNQSNGLQLLNTSRYLFWVVRGVGLYRLDLIDISKTINKNVSPEVILEDSNLGGFLVNSDHFRIIISVCSQSTINAISLDG